MSYLGADAALVTLLAEHPAPWVIVRNGQFITAVNDARGDAIFRATYTGDGDQVLPCNHATEALVEFINASAKELP